MSSFTLSAVVADPPMEDTGGGGEALVESWHPIARIGQYHDKRYGDFKITAQDADAWKRTLHTHQNGEVCIDRDHGSAKGNTRAAGWIRDIKVQGEKILGQIAWTKEGRDDVRNGYFKFVSPEFTDAYKDESGAVVGKALLATALTNRPFLRKGMPALQLSMDGDECEVIELAGPHDNPPSDTSGEGEPMPESGDADGSLPDNRVELAFDEGAHPRDKNGRFITKGSTIMHAGSEHRVTGFGKRGEVFTQTGASDRDVTLTRAEARRSTVTKDGEEPHTEPKENDYRRTGKLRDDPSDWGSSPREAHRRTTQRVRDSLRTTIDVPGKGHNRGATYRKRRKAYSLDAEACALLLHAKHLDALPAPIRKAVDSMTARGVKPSQAVLTALRLLRTNPAAKRAYDAAVGRADKPTRHILLTCADPPAPEVQDEVPPPVT